MRLLFNNILFNLQLIWMLLKGLHSRWKTACKKGKALFIKNSLVFTITFVLDFIHTKNLMAKANLVTFGVIWSAVRCF